MNSFAKVFATVAVLIFGASAAGAATLQAKVLEVRSGNTLVAANINRSVRIRLKAVAPPEAGQPYADAAKDHLKTLLLDKEVTIDYTHFVGGYLEARVILNGVDIGSQMLRDGAAWFDHGTDFELNEADRDLYAQCEQAARTEKRGLWQQEKPVAPWEFRRLQKEKADEVTKGKSPLVSLRTNRTSFSNSDLMGSLTHPPSPSSPYPGLRPISQNGTFERWTNFESPLAHFSVMIPSNGVEGSSVTTDQHGLPVSLEILAAGNEQAFVMLISGKGPNDNLTTATALDKSMRELVNNRAATKFSVKPVRDLKLGDYYGRQYSLTSDLFSGTARVYTKRIGEERQVYVLYALTRPGAEAISNQFLNSFKIGQ